MPEMLSSSRTPSADGPPLSGGAGGLGWTGLDGGRARGQGITSAGLAGLAQGLLPRVAVSEAGGEQESRGAEGD